ncbi:MAG: YbaN family protein [Bacteriovoracaceae bacterium]|jgi:uncharacterized protein|nr:YbaN family protein [Bacteriovoracaceae bacterium]
MFRYTAKYLFLTLGHLSLILGAIGVILPILPTTPFMLLSAYFYSKGSIVLHQWLINNKYFGSMICDWEKSKVIRLKAKIYATTMIIPLFTYSLYFVDVVLFIKVIIFLVGVSVLTFIWSRPSREMELMISCELV